MSLLSGLAGMAIELSWLRVQHDLLPRLVDDSDDVEALLLLMNAVRTVRHLTKAADIGTWQYRAEVLVASILDATKRVQNGTADSA
ncbi:unnamed protein product [Urochloa humidicola]